jgi:hypothetical protein
MTGEMKTDNSAAPAIHTFPPAPPAIHTPPDIHTFPPAHVRQQLYLEHLREMRAACRKAGSSEKTDDSADSNKKNDDSADGNKKTDDSAGSSKKSGRMTFLSTGPAPGFTSPSLKAELGEEMDECFEARWSCDQYGWVLTFEPIRGVAADALTAARAKWNNGDFLCKTCRGTGLTKLEPEKGDAGTGSGKAHEGKGSRGGSRSRSPARTAALRGATYREQV